MRSFNDFEPIKKLILNLKTVSNNYSEFLNPRDMAELVASFCQLSMIASRSLPGKQGKTPVSQSLSDIKNAHIINFDKELRLLAKRSALMLSSMNKKS